MKIPARNHSSVATRSLLAVGFACALTTLSTGVASAQDSNATTTRSTGKVDPTLSANERPKLTADEQDFVKMAAGGNKAEVELAELALKNGESAGVKEFAKMMIKDHGEANKELMALAKRENLADFEPMVTDKDKTIYESMVSLKGKAFDEAYAKNAVEDHTKDLQDYKEARNKVVSTQVLDYVKKTEPIISHHLTMAKKLEKGETKS